MSESEKVEFRQSTPVQIRFNDIDAFGHVNNATFQEYFDFGRMHYFYQAFDGKLFTDELALVIASIKTDFLAPILLHDNIEVRTKVDDMGNKSLKMLQHIVDVKTNQVKAICFSVMVCFQKSDFVSVTIPQLWRDKFNEIDNAE
jgi:acyl-CoA thioester hydrolase